MSRKYVPPVPRLRVAHVGDWVHDEDGYRGLVRSVNIRNMAKVQYGPDGPFKTHNIRDLRYDVDSQEMYPGS